MTDDDPFTQAAQRMMRRKDWERAERNEARRPSKPKIYKSDRDAPMVPGPQEKKQIEQSLQYRKYRRHKRAEIRSLLESPNRIPFLHLSRLLRRMTVQDGPQLVDHVLKAQWLVDADRLTRYIVLAVISDRISKLRVQNGYDPFDDSLPGELPTAYELIRAHLSN